ncbi:MAG: PilZ domain-containing protein [Gemmatimonadetes bacterium]|nr:PilZ domain-containing protein [Gemmatimonadota bacterium]
MTDLGGAFLVEHLDVGGVRISTDVAGVTLTHRSQGIGLELDVPGVGKLMDFLRSCRVNRFNRRRAFRVPVEPGSGLEVEVEIDGVTHRAMTGDVSFTGILLEPSDDDAFELEIGQTVGVTLRLDGDCVTLESSVRRKAVEGVGLQFAESVKGDELDPVPELARVMANLERLWLQARVKTRVDEGFAELEISDAPVSALGDAFDTSIVGVPADEADIRIGDVIVRDSDDRLTLQSSSRPEVKIHFDVRGVGALFDFLRSSSVNPANRRRGFRIPLRAADGVAVVIHHRGTDLPAAPADVSLSGVLVEPEVAWPEEIRVGTEVDVTLRFAGEATRLASVVRRRAEGAYGIEFLDATNGEALTPPADLARMIARLERRWLAEYVAA